MSVSWKIGTALAIYLEESEPREMEEKEELILLLLNLSSNSNPFKLSYRLAAPILYCLPDIGEV